MELSNMQAEGLSRKSVFLATFALCGFANFMSIGIQIGGIGSLAPERRSDLAALGLKSLIGGTLASLLSATIAGLFFQ
jgi:CNT family concentrative nucleoside transporter